MTKLLIIAHTPSHNTRAIAQTIEAVAKKYCDLPVEIHSPFDVTSDMIKNAQGVIFFTPENFGYMSGALKDLFDRTYYDVIEVLQGMPYMLIIRAGQDGTGCQRSVVTILTGLAWRRAQPDLILKGAFDPIFHSQLEEPVATFAAALTF